MNALQIPGPGDSYDWKYDQRERRDEAIERIEAELYADDEEVSEAVCDFLSFVRCHKNHPQVIEAIHSLRDGDYIHFGDLCSKAVVKYIAEKAQDKYEDAHP
jgi:hypothetical protein